MSHPPPVENLPADVVLVAETESFGGETLQLALSKPGGGDGDKVERDHEYDGDGAAMARRARAEAIGMPFSMLIALP